MRFEELPSQLLQCVCGGSACSPELDAFGAAVAPAMKADMDAGAPIDVSSSAGMAAFVNRHPDLKAASDAHMKCMIAQSARHGRE